MIGHQLHAQIIDVPESISFMDIETPTLSHWKNQDIEKYQEKQVSISLSNQYVSSGQQSMKLVFPKGHLPTIYTEQIPIQDWSRFKTFSADLTLQRDALVVFRFLQEKSTRDNHWDGFMGRFERAALMKKGRHTMIACLKQKRDHQFRPEYGRVIRLEIALYDALEGDTLYIDNMRLSTKLPLVQDIPLSQRPEYFPTLGKKFQVLSTDAFMGKPIPSQVSGYQELAQITDKWWNTPQSSDLVEAKLQRDHDMQKKLEHIQKSHPQVKLWVLRNGKAGFHHQNPQELYRGCDDTYLNCHEPESMLMHSGIVNHGHDNINEIFMRHRTALLRFDLSHLPADTKVLYSALQISRTEHFETSRCHLNKNLWVIEPCNRPWVESEVNAFQYARHKYWNNYSGKQWHSQDPDSHPIFASFAHGQGQRTIWDLTSITKKWIKGDIENHGFWLYGDSRDWLLRAHFSESKDQDKRPTLYLITL